MKGKDIAVFSILGVLGVISVTTGFIAERERLTPSQFVSCVLPPNPALYFALVSALSLVIARIVIDVTTRCNSCQGNPQDPSNLYKVVAWLSWLMFVIALAVLLFGAGYGIKNPYEYYSRYGLECMIYFVKPGVFAGGACASLISVILGGVHYMNFFSGKRSENQQGYPPGAYGTLGGIPMGQPQFSPQPVQPVGYPQGEMPMGYPQFPPQPPQQHV